MSRSEHPKLKAVVEELHDVKTKWYSIGIQLEVSDSKLDEIDRTANGDIEQTFRRMIQEWLNQINPEPTWAGIVEALRSRSVNALRLAENLEKRYDTRSVASSAAQHDTTDSHAVVVPFLSQGSAEQVLDPDVQRELDEMHQLFEKLRLDVYNFLRKEPPDLNEFCVFVSSPPPAWKIKRQKPLAEVHLDRIMEDDATFKKIYIVLSQYINWYNYELLKSIVEKYGNPPIKQRMQDYCTKVDELEKRTNLDEVKNIPLCQPQPDSTAFIARMPNHRCNQFRLNEIRKMQHALTDEAGIDHAAVRAHMVVQSSVEIIFLVPLALAPYLMVSSVCPLLTSQEPLPENVYERCVHIIHTEEAFRLMGRSPPPPKLALPAPPLHRSSFSFSSSYSDEPRPKPANVLNPQPTLNPRHVQVFHNKVLDAGVSTVVCKARLNHLPCVAKYVHPQLVESNEWPLEKFLEGCKFLESCHHPNIVPFLGTHYDDSLKVPILLMEKMEQSLYNYLKHAAHPVPIHTQLDICHDIAQGLEYIHSREYIHGDLTATNILLQGRRAKIGGMMTLQCKSPDAQLSLCPGTPAYMPMRSFSFPDYDESIDCFSFGVVAIHIATCEMPTPISHSTELSGETERYSKNIVKVDTGHPMLPIILNCLKEHSEERPSASSLCDEISAMKETQKYKTSLSLATLPVQLLSLQNKIVQQKLHEKKEELNAMKQQYQARLQEEREVLRQEIFAEAGKEMESVRRQANVERERIEASFQMEREQVRNKAKSELQKATDEKTKLEKDLRCEIEQVKTTWSEKVKKAIEECKTKSEKEQKMLKEQSQHKLRAMMEEKDKLQHESRDMQTRNEDLGGKVRELEIEKQLLREKLEAADQSYARLLQAQHGQ